MINILLRKVARLTPQRFTNSVMQAAFKIIFLLLAAIAGTGSGFTQNSPDFHTSPAENPPQIRIASSIDAEDNLLLVTYNSIIQGFRGDAYNERILTKVSLKNVLIVTPNGDEVSVKAAREQINGVDTPILVTGWKFRLPKFYRQLFTPKTLHFIFAEEAPVWPRILAPGKPVR